MIKRGHLNLWAATITDPKPYTPSDLVLVFNAAWAVIRPKKRRLKYRQEARLRLDLAKCIVKLAKRGVTDARELRRQAIEHMILSDT